MRERFNNNFKKIAFAAGFASLALGYYLSQSATQEAPGVCPVPTDESVEFFCHNMRVLQCAMHAIANGITTGFSSSEIALIKQLYQYCQNAGDLLPQLPSSFVGKFGMYAMAVLRGCAGCELPETPSLPTP
ncbi:MAG TPA: hypothetical protein VJK30_05935 [Coxiellaceae bacterium]|nr:hypothetical protein [Coxiellaceae bacterium]